MKLTYKKKLFLNFIGIFAIFTFVIIAMQYNRERIYKIDSLRSSLEAYSTIINNYIEAEKNILDVDYADVSDYKILAEILPTELRYTIIDKTGKVITDNNKQGVKISENHLERPEVASANINGLGYAIRKSASTGEEYYYQAKSYKDYFIRVALPYDLNVQALLQGDNLYIYFIVALFIVAFLSLILLSDRMGRSLSTLRDFAYSIGKNEKIDDSYKFADGELGEIGQKLVENYRMLERSREELKQEKDKLILHFSHSTAGIAFFSPSRNVIYSNTLFVTHLNTISDSPTLNIDDFFTISEFEKGVKFINESMLNSEKISVYEDKITKNRQYYTIRILVFADKSVEVILNNITSLEKNRILKQEMTSNIAHELRTPVSSISGYMETLMTLENISAEKSKYFIERCYSQVKRLSDLIRDISIITRIEEGAAEIEKDKINISAIIRDVESELKGKLTESGATIINNIPEGTEIKGNTTLAFAIFRNLIDNSISYGGSNITITIDRFFEDEDFYYFSLWDNGKGVDDKHLTKIFDRFYRVSEGRTREDGGSGLGLSIVKNAILFHHGTISAKNRKDAGLEVIFSLKK